MMTRQRQLAASTQGASRIACIDILFWFRRIYDSIYAQN
jgi:hypothetical protein